MKIKIKNCEYYFDIDKIVNYLEPYKEKLSTLYNFEIPTEKELKIAMELGLLSKKEIQTLLSIDNYFHRNDLMKEYISKKLSRTKNKNKLLSYYIWIIKDWGGIRGIKDTGLLERIELFLSSYNNTFEVNFDKISSTSKVINFISPSNYIIYDSRVAFALNWIILKTSASNSFFLIPQGRNSKLTAFDMNTLIRIKHVDLYKNSYANNSPRLIYNCDKELFIPDKHCYHLMNVLFKEIANKLWHNSSLDYKPYYTEMLLFAMADKEIFKDILNTINFVNTSNSYDILT